MRLYVSLGVLIVSAGDPIMESVETDSIVFISTVLFDAVRLGSKIKRRTLIQTGTPEGDLVLGVFNGKFFKKYGMARQIRKMPLHITTLMRSSSPSS